MIWNVLNVFNIFVTYDKINDISTYLPVLLVFTFLDEADSSAIARKEESED